jgi:hypothetical protein
VKKIGKEKKKGTLPSTTSQQSLGLLCAETSAKVNTLPLPPIVCFLTLSFGFRRKMKDSVLCYSITKALSGFDS